MLPWEVVHTPVFVVEQYNLILAYGSDALWLRMLPWEVVHTPVFVYLSLSSII